MSANRKLDQSLRSASDPAVGAVAITGSDQVLDVTARGVYVATAGNLKIDMPESDAVTFVGLLAGQYYPFAITKIYDTGTSITGLVLL